MPTQASISLGNQILQALMPGKSLSTMALADAVQADIESVRRRCHALAENGLLSCGAGGRPGAFCIDCKEPILSPGQICIIDKHQIRKRTVSFRVWHLTQDGQAHANANINGDQANV